MLSELGLDPTDEELQDMIDNADANGSGSIEFPEFLNLMIKRVCKLVNSYMPKLSLFCFQFALDDDKMADMKAAFRVFDKNNDQKISR